MAAVVEQGTEAGQTSSAVGMQEQTHRVCQKCRQEPFPNAIPEQGQETPEDAADACSTGEADDEQAAAAA